jgi:hypothetical protein
MHSSADCIDMSEAAVKAKPQIQHLLSTSPMMDPEKAGNGKTNHLSGQS